MGPPPVDRDVHVTALRDLDRLPGEWNVRAAEQPWTTFPPDGFGDQMYMRETDSPFIAVASQPLGGKSGEQWIADLAQWDPGCEPQTEPFTIDGEPGLLTVQCGLSEGMPAALVTKEDRGYLISLYRIGDVPWFKEILATVQLHPEEAVDPSPSP